ncbi:12057_t:CDS:2, partial [Funneliformis geosporum]
MLSEDILSKVRHNESRLGSNSAKKRKIKPFKGTEANECTNFYITPENTVKDLGQRLIDGHYIFIEGLRQSGKTTSIIATANYVQRKSNDNEFPVPNLEIYVVTFSVGLDINNGKNAFWKSVCKIFRARNRKQFSFDDTKECTADIFLSFFERGKSPPISFIIDEFSNLFGKNSAIIEEFVNTLQFLKNRLAYCVHSFALVGVGQFPIQTELTSSSIIIPAFFNEEEIEMLLSEYRNQYGLKLDIKRIAEDIFERTKGYKGFVGACCKAIETEVMVNENELLYDHWMRYSSTRLIKFIKELGTYRSIFRAIKQLSSKQTDIVGMVLRYGSYSYKCDYDDNELYQLFAEGIVISRTTNEIYIELECSSPILRSIMLSMIYGPEFDITSPPQAKDEIDVRWLLENTIENLAIQHIFVQQALNVDGNPSEYAFQAEFATVLKYLLSNVYPALQYRVIVEAKERDVNANKKNFDEHLVRANYYNNLHGCSMYMINLCTTNNKLTDNFGSEYPEVTLVHIIYDISKGMADIIYEDCRKSLTIKRSAWKV